MHLHDLVKPEKVGLLLGGFQRCPLVANFVFMKQMKTMLLQLTSQESKARHRLQSGRNRYIVQSDKKDEK